MVDWLMQTSLTMKKYPIIVSRKSRLCDLYLRLHLCLAHAECNQMYRMVQTELYIPRLKPKVKSIIHKCKTCIILKQRPCTQLSSLYRQKDAHILLFFTLLALTCSALRNAPLLKDYVCLFVCFQLKLSIWSHALSFPLWLSRLPLLDSLGDEDYPFG